VAAWFTNLQALSREVLTLRASTSTREVTAARSELLGPRAWAHKVIVAWAPRGTLERAEVPVWLTFVGDGDRALLAGDTDAPPSDQPAARPSWLAEPVQIARRGQVVVIAGDGNAALWLRRAAAAAGAVRSRADAYGLRWSGALVVEVPSTRSAFERSLGVGAGAFAGIGAAAWPRGSRRGWAAVHVVVNPEVVAALPPEGIGVLLAHEATHVATRAADSAAPTWLREGFADQLAYQAYPASRRAAEEPLRRAYRAGWRPTALPPDSAFAAQGERLDLAYAQAWSLCRLLADRHSEAGLGGFYRRVDADEPVPQALRAEFGIGVADVLREWRADLARLF
jgi:hypothetical protein